MPVLLGRNISSLMISRRLSEASSRLATNFARLSSGSRINQASDDAAGLSVSSSLQVSARVYSQGIRNLNDGISALSIAQGALEQLSVIATRQMELSEQAANGSYGVEQRTALHNEANALTQEYNRIIQTTKFNNESLLDGTPKYMVMQGGFGTEGTIAINIGEQLGRAVGSGAFYNAVSYNDPTRGGIASGDVNNDGTIDLVGASWATGGVTVDLGNGDGTFRAPTNYLTSSDPRTVTLADLNGDGNLDVLTRSTSMLQVLLGNGNGTFRAAYSIGNSTDSGPSVYDVNNDGLLDIITANVGRASISVYLGNGNGSYIAPTTYAIPNGASINSGVSLSDLNGDGNMDAIVGDGSINKTWLFFGNANGTFRAASSVPYYGSAVDVDNDGDMDLVGGGPLVSISLNNGNGTFRSPITFAPGNVNMLGMADFNGDNLVDIAFAFNGASTVYIYSGNGNGTFAFTSTYAANIPQSGTTGDFNKDGILDIASSGDTTQFRVAIGKSRMVTTIANIDLRTQSAARSALESSRSVLENIGREIGNIGAFQKRIAVGISNLATGRDTFIQANSRIMDADIAEESASLVQENIRQQIASSLLAQANQLPALALSLLR